MEGLVKVLKPQQDLYKKQKCGEIGKKVCKLAIKFGHNKKKGKSKIKSF